MASEEDEPETVFDKIAVTWCFLLAFDAGSYFFNRQVKRVRQRLNEFEKWETAAQQRDIQAKVQNFPRNCQRLLPTVRFRGTKGSRMIEDSADDVQNDQVFLGRGRGAVQKTPSRLSSGEN